MIPYIIQIYGLRISYFYYIICFNILYITRDIATLVRPAQIMFPPLTSELQRRQAFQLFGHMIEHIKDTVVVIGSRIN